MRSERKKSNLLGMVMKTHQALFVIILLAMLPIPVFSDMPMATPTEEPPLIQFTNAHLTNLQSEIEYYGAWLVGAKMYMGFENMGGSGTVTIRFNTIWGLERSETYEIENGGRYDLFIHVGLFNPLLNDQLEVSSPNLSHNPKKYIFEEGKITRIKEILLIPILPPPEVYYVDHRANGSGNGLNWENALQHVQTALQLARFYEGSVHEIRVAQGTYKPDTLWSSGLVRYATFHLIDNIEVKGGYAGVGSPDPNARDVNLFETILSGDRDGNDGLNFSNNDENSYHVIASSGTDATAVLDGFTITGGNTSENSGGGGMVNFESGSPTILNCKFTANKASFGGGVCNYDNCGPTLSDCTFNGNMAGQGGGMYNSVNGSPTLTNCDFKDNSAAYGAGMLNYDNNPMVTNCAFSGNLAGKTGGGMYNWGSSPTVTNCMFTNNPADEWGGGMFNDANSSPTVTSCIFSSNSADYGGGLLNFSSSPMLTNCTFTANSADSYGGGIYEFDNNPTLTSCAFSGNVAGIGGGGTNIDDSTATLVNCTFRGNAAANGNALACESEPKAPSNVELANCILWDGVGEIWNNDGSTITISYSDVQGVWMGQGNIDADPSFLDPGHWDPNGTPNDAEDDFWVDGDYHLQAGSPCIDAGDNTAVPPDANDIDGDGNKTEPIPWDINRNPRIIGDKVDMGAYEFQGVNLITGDFCGANFGPADGYVDVWDLMQFANHWHTSSSDTNNWDSKFDLAGLSFGDPDGYVDVWDLMVFADHWHEGQKP